MRDLALDSPLFLCLLVVVFGAVSSLMPFSPAEPVLVGVAAVAPPWLLLPLVLLATVSHMSTKTLVFIGGSRVERVFAGRHRQRFERARLHLAGRTSLQRSTLFVSSVTGLPPFYLTTAICGTLHMPLAHFLVLATTGRAIRFATLVFLPQLFRPAALPAQSPTSTVNRPAAISVAGEGPETFVLISGVVGSVAGLRRIEERLAAQRSHVISIDPYLLSIDSADVSFEALARRVDDELTKRGVTSVRVVGHAHGGGVALRVAARSTGRVTELYLLDVGAQAVNKSPVFSSSLRLVPLVVRLPFGRDFVRGRILDGLRANSGRTNWLDASTQRAYTEPMLDDIDRVIELAYRLDVAREPETLATVVARIDVPVTVILGELKRPASPGTEEMDALAPLGGLLRIEVLAGVAHFPQEEAPDDVVGVLLRRLSLAAKPGGVR